MDEEVKAQMSTPQVCTVIIYSLMLLHIQRTHTGVQGLALAMIQTRHQVQRGIAGPGAN